MDTKPLERFATWARRELISVVDAQASTVLAKGSVPRTEHPEAVRRLESEIENHGRQHIIDKVAYTWFNRIIALRFMDVRGYTDAGVVSPVQGQEDGQPEILSDAKRGNLDSDVVTNTRTADAILGLIDGTRHSTHAEGEAYAMLLTEYCRYWHKFMPFMFEREGDYTELLVPANLLAEGAILSRARKVLTEEVCEDVEVIGWLYQFYISERKDEVFAGFKQNKKAGADEIPAATQLFTPHWIVRYLVENSVGRLWMLNHPESRVIDEMDYYIAPIDEESDFLKISGPEDLTVIDPACGSGHMLTYAFDLLYAIYEEAGYAPLDIPGLILSHNLHGTEIDPRAGALAAFALTMKARAKQRTFFNRKVEPQICIIEPLSFGPDEIDVLTAEQGDYVTDEKFFNQFEHADTLGSLIQPNARQTMHVKTALDKTNVEGEILYAGTADRARKLVLQAEMLSTVYAIVIANPPYLSDKSFDDTLKVMARKTYPETKNNLYGMFIDRAITLLKSQGYLAFITLHSWMSGAKYEKFRRRMAYEFPIQVLAHLGSGAFDSLGGQVVSTAAFVLGKSLCNTAVSTFFDLSQTRGEAAKGISAAEMASGQLQDEVINISQSAFLDLPGATIAYAVRAEELVAFRQLKPLAETADFRQGMATTDNDRFLRRWSELSIGSITFGAEPQGPAGPEAGRWFPYNKGGGDRKWYGHNDLVIDYQHGGQVLIDLVRRKYPRISDPEFVIKNRKFYFRPSVTYSALSGGSFSARLCEAGFIFDTKGSSVFPREGMSRNLLASLLNSSVAARFLDLLAPTLDVGLYALEGIPAPSSVPAELEEVVSQAVTLATIDWDSSEQSWDFARLPILSVGESHDALRSRYSKITEIWQRTVSTMRELQERSNSLLSDAYGIDSDVLSEVRDIDVTLDCNPKYRYGEPLAPEDAETRFKYDILNDLVSYAIGCMFGRYSLDEPGLILADQGATLQDYLAKVPSPTLAPDVDNVIPFVDDGWFEDDIVERFREFLRITFGTEHFEDNLRYVEESLGVKSIRDYFITKNGKSKFYDDHVKRYKKRPIYWMFSSPKGSFNALIYMHRYNPSTVSTVLNEYLREYRAKLEVALSEAEKAAAGGSAKDQKEADRLRRVLVELAEYEHDVLYPLATRQLPIDLDDGVLVNYLRFGSALKNIGLETNRKKVEGWDWPTNKLEPLP